MSKPINTIKPIAPACARNRGPILEVLSQAFANVNQVLEIGSGTGEHGVYFAEHIPGLDWQCSDVFENLPGIEMWVEEANLPNLPKPIELDLNTIQIYKQYDAIFSANTLHIISTTLVESFFRLIADITTNHATMVIYGPFNYNGNFTSESNAQFELWLKERDPLSGIRDFEWIHDLANNAGFTLIKDYEMPANNRCLHWQRN